ncbi:ATP SYNTHASE C CHAIN [Mycoplasmopsis pulmonis]|uniref:ATP synthase subunit c n=1 Tax=Mycoplasmopsis pulmonis (strain UAB CTIP) TaxID=272635 RepID=ATPL_MYCPU|nr:ATP synthase F0 subunit C [Mycoplasmopsis pulmonis]Q98QU0.1 RecName: Full=ATP synthase subunit c; AltName: Full=ATP synthase F(0) sector subunit c; AltName: Full=F-type ATPase subunit c; Short=F-ATPase subunit c; AltName: Full=Lipid-binding protein [Mycoplasmopsis pulmonis UAB CTIP]CAC13444.1 ATP SYNTHASE C CHAIN [Mycoplasmopsis pulmonis]
MENIISLLALKNDPTSATTGAGLVAVGAGLASIGNFGTGLGQGLSAGRAAEAVGRNPEAIKKIRSLMIIGMAISESASLYSFIIAILLVFVY